MEQRWETMGSDVEIPLEYDDVEEVRPLEYQTTALWRIAPCVELLRTRLLHLEVV